VINTGQRERGSSSNWWYGTCTAVPRDALTSAEQHCHLAFYCAEGCMQQIAQRRLATGRLPSISQPAYLPLFASRTPCIIDFLLITLPGCCRPRLLRLHVDVRISLLTAYVSLVSVYVRCAQVSRCLSQVSDERVRMLLLIWCDDELVVVMLAEIRFCWCWRHVLSDVM